MRATFSLSDELQPPLQDVSARFAEGNASLVTEAALYALFAQPAAEIERIIARRRLSRKIVSRADWITCFWAVFAQEMGSVDRIDNPYTARTYGEHYAVLLLKDVGHYDEDPDPFVLQIAPQIWTQENANQHRRFHIERARSPIDAAEEIATWLRDVQKKASTDAP